MKKILFTTFTFCITLISYAQSTVISDRLQFAGTNTLNTSLTQGQIISYNWGSLQLASRSNGAGKHISFHTGIGAIERLRILDNGNIGIGTTNPAYALDITSSSADVNFRIEDGATGAPIRLRSTNSGEAYIYMGNEASSIRRTGGDFRFWANGIDMAFSTNNGSTNHMFINTAGNVGIGNTSPNALLDIKRTSSSSTEMLRFTDGGYKLGSIQSLGSSDGYGLFMTGRTEGGNDPVPALTLAGYANDVSPDHDYDAAVSVRGFDVADGSKLTNMPVFRVMNSHTDVHLSVEANGNIGIGTTSPTEKLSVDGKVLAKKVRVSVAAADWPDYVFAPSYELRSLSELETYIKQNQHLPEVPSAKEVVANGLDLGGMDATLLKKVEELTLYTIDQEKKITQQSKENQELKDRLLKIEAILKTLTSK